MSGIPITSVPTGRCWFQSPSALALPNDKVLFGVQQQTQHVLVWDGTAWSDVTLGGVNQYDDHNQPTFWRRADGIVFAFYSEHHGSVIRARCTTNPDDPSSWEPEWTIDAGGEMLTYPSPLDLGNGILLLVCRRAQYSGQPSNIRHWIAFPLTQDGVNTTPVNRFLIWAGVYSGDSAQGWAYIRHAAKEGRADFACNPTAGTPGCLNRELYHCSLDVTVGPPYVFRKSDGTALEPRYIAGGIWPFGPEERWSEATLVWTCPVGQQLWVLDVGYWSDGHPVIMFQYGTTASLQYAIARWLGSSWQVADVALAGPQLIATTNYTGCACLDGNAVIASVQRNGVHEIERFESTDGGLAWVSVSVHTTGSEFPNIRPVTAGGKLVCMGGGSYPHYVSYESLAFDISEPIIVPPPEWSLSNADSPWGDSDFRIRDGLVEQRQVA